MRGETRVFISGLEVTEGAASPPSPHVMVSKQLFNLPLAWQRVPIHATTYGCDQRVLKNGLCKDQTLPTETISHSWAQDP